MITVALTAGALLGTLGHSLYSNKKAKEADEKLNNLYEKESRDLDNLFNKQYYENYMDRADVQNSLRTLTDNMAEESRIERGIERAEGSTPEIGLAKQRERNRVYGEVFSSMAANGDTWKKGLMTDYLNQKRELNSSLRKRYNDNYSTSYERAMDGRDALLSSFDSYGAKR